MSPDTFYYILIGISYSRGFAMKKGIIVEESVFYGVVQPDFGVQKQAPNVPQNNQQPHPQLSDQPLYSATGYRKQGQTWIKGEIFLLTTQKFHQIKIQQISKMKVKQVGGFIQEQYNVLKLTANGIDHWYSFTPNHTYHFFYKILLARLLRKNYNVVDEEFINGCQGNIMKLSEFLHNWEPRYAEIDINGGLRSYRNRNEPASMVISETQEIWTRFQLIEGKQYLVFKLWMGGIVKQEIGVPLEHSIKWCKALYSLVTKPQAKILF